jgi:hypothetical protein
MSDWPASMIKLPLVSLAPACLCGVNPDAVPAVDFLRPCLLQDHRVTMPGRTGTPHNGELTTES